MTSQPERDPGKVDGDDDASVTSAYETLRPTWVAGPGRVTDSDSDHGAAASTVFDPEDDPDLLVLDEEDVAADSAAGTERSSDIEDEPMVVTAEVITTDADTASDDEVSATGEGRAAGEGSAVGNAHGSLDPQWHDIQAQFVDDPRGSVEQAAAAADAAVSALVETLHERQAALAPGSGPSDDPGATEQLREALRSYRVFCQNLAEISEGLPGLHKMAS